MMIKAVRSISNVGRFAAFSGGDNLPFYKLTVVFAENGRGKTTLVDILRSLQSGHGHCITGRHTLGATGPSAVSILLDSGPATFQNGRWDRTLPDLEVFDETFIHANVYAGDFVELDHRRNLYRMILGDEGVQLARRVDDLAGDRETARQYREAEQRVKEFLPEDISLEDFLALPQPDNNLAASISALEGQLQALDQDRDVRETEYIRVIQLPSLPERFFDILATELAEVSASAECAMRAHIQQCGMDDRGEAWLRQGLKYESGGRCPFCAQDLTGNDLIESYRRFFNASYIDLTTEIENMAKELDKRFSSEEQLQLQQDIFTNQRLCSFWSQFVTLNLPDLPASDEIQKAWRELHKAARALLLQKQVSPLRKVCPAPNFGSAHKRWAELTEQVGNYRAAVDRANVRDIAHRKQSVENSHDLQEIDLDQELRRLQATRIRYSPEADNACCDYIEARERKNSLEEQRRDARERLDAYTQNTLSRYQAPLSEALKNFGTGFKIRMGERPQFSAGRPSVFYEIVINKARVPLGNEKTDPETPSFRNTLSSGDRSALAFAFFLARLQQDQRLAEKVIVLDDPITNQDDVRSAQTQRLIRDLVERAKQVIVLSHAPRFLRGIWDQVASNKMSVAILPTADDNSILGVWHVTGADRGLHNQE
jgi:wobble nucleotide-excising tRNase